MNGRFLLQVTGHISLFYQYRKYPKHLLKANLRPKNIFLGVIRPKVSFWDTWQVFGILSVLVKQLPVTCDLPKKPAAK